MNDINITAVVVAVFCFGVCPISILLIGIVAGWRLRELRQSGKLGMLPLGKTKSGKFAIED